MVLDHKIARLGSFLTISCGSQGGCGCAIKTEQLGRGDNDWSRYIGNVVETLHEVRKTLEDGETELEQDIASRIGKECRFDRAQSRLLQTAASQPRIYAIKKASSTSKHIIRT